MEDESDWKVYRRDQQNRRTERLPKRTKSIVNLRNEGYDVIELTPYQFRINGVIDLYPIHNRWHDLRNGERGGAQNLSVFVKEYLTSHV